MTHKISLSAGPNFRFHILWRRIGLTKSVQIFFNKFWGVCRIIFRWKKVEIIIKYEIRRSGPNRRGRRPNRSGFEIRQNIIVKYQVLHFPINFHYIWAIIAGFTSHCKYAFPEGLGVQNSKYCSSSSAEPILLQFVLFSWGDHAESFSVKKIQICSVNLKFGGWVRIAGVGDRTDSDPIRFRIRQCNFVK